MNTAAFIGLGIMGAPMAGNLIKNGFELIVNDQSEKAMEKLTSLGARIGEYDAIGRCGIIFMILPSGKVTKSVLFENGLAEKTKKGGLICDFTSQSPDEAVFTHSKLAEMGIDYVDAPVSGGEIKAISGELSIMAGGEEENFKSLIPYFKAIGKSFSHMGPAGAGNAAKLANQIITNVTIGAIAEAVNLANKAGIDTRKLFDAIKDGAAASAMLSSRAEKIISRDYAPGAKISVNKKDMENVITFAKSQSLLLPLAESYYGTLCRISELGLDSLDISSVPEYYGKLN